MSELEGSREYVNHELVAEIFHFLPNEVTEFMYDSLNEIVYNVMEGINLRILELKPDKEVELTEVYYLSFVLFSILHALNYQCMYIGYEKPGNRDRDSDRQIIQRLSKICAE